MQLASQEQIADAQMQAKTFIAGHQMWDNSDAHARRAIAEYILHQQGLTMYDLEN